MEGSKTESNVTCKVYGLMSYMSQVNHFDVMSIWWYVYILSNQQKKLLWMAEIRLTSWGW